MRSFIFLVNSIVTCLINMLELIFITINIGMIAFSTSATSKV